MSEFNLVNALQSNNQATKGASVVNNAAQSGTLNNGVSFSLANGVNSIFNLAEELSFLGSSLSHRRQTQRQRNSQRPKMHDDLKQLKKLQDAAFSIKKLDQIKSCINYLQDNPNDIKYIEQWLGEFSKDKSEQYIALLTLRQELSSKQGNEVAIKSIQDAIDVLREKHEVHVGVEGFNTISVANEQGFDQSELRNHFQKNSQEFGSMSSSLNWLTKLFGAGKLFSSAQEVFKQKASEYHLGGVFIEKAQLITLMKEMSMLKTMMGVYDQCIEAAHIVAKEPKGSLANTALRLFEFALDLQSKQWIEQGDIQSFAEKLCLYELSEQNVLGVQLKKIISFIPGHSYLNEEQKQQCLDTLTDYLDTAARNEYAGA